MKKLNFLLLFLLANIVVISAQNYKPLTSISDKNCIGYKKMQFKSGERFYRVLYDAQSQDEIKKLQCNIYKSDFTLETEIISNIDTKKVNMIGGHTPPYLFQKAKKNNLFTSYDYFLSFEYYSGENRYVRIIDKDGKIVRDSIPNSWEGPKMIEINEKPKIVGDILEFDTIRYTNGGWATVIVQTSIVVDVETGKNEFIFPRGTKFSGIFEVDGAKRIFTTNDNVRRYKDGRLSVLDASIQIYNVDYTKYKKYSIDISEIKDLNLAYNNLFIPLVGKSNVRFFHNYSFEDVSQQFHQVGFVTDELGNRLKEYRDKIPFWTREKEALYLPDSQKEVLVFSTTSGNLIYSFSNLDSIGKCKQYIKDKQGKVMFIDVTDNSVKIMNEDLSVVKTVNIPENYKKHKVWADRDIVSSDNKIELVFYDNYIGNKGMLILNEDNKKLFKNDTLMPLVSQMSPGDTEEQHPIILNVPKEKYGRIIAQKPNYKGLENYQRVGMFYVWGEYEGEQQSISIEMRRIGDYNWRLSMINDTIDVDENNKAIFKDIPEGEYILRTLGKNDEFIPTYYPNECLWEKAEPVVYNGDSTSLKFAIQLQKTPPELPEDNVGVISGSITRKDSLVSQQMRVVSNEELPSFDLFLVNQQNQQIIATTTSDNLGKYTFEHIPYGQYEILINVEGKSMLSSNKVTLNEKHSEVTDANYEVTDKGVEARMPSGTHNVLESKNVICYPNPVQNELYFVNPTNIDFVRIVNTNGQIVLQQKLQNSNKILVNNLQKGVYFITVNLKTGKQQTNKLIKK